MEKRSADLTTAPNSHEPKRERGRRRVEAIVVGAAEVFAEKGFGAATMTEIAARSNTAIGSLYRFFPTKDTVAEMLIARHHESVALGFAAITKRAGGLSPAALADELVDFVIVTRTHRAAAIALADARGILAKARQKVATTIRGEIAKMLTAAAEALPRARAEAIAAVVERILRIIVDLDEEQTPENDQILAEARELCRLYLSSRLGDFVAASPRRR